MSSLAEDSKKSLSPCETAARTESTSDSGRDDTRGTARVDRLCKVLGIEPHEFGAYIQSRLKRKGIPFVEDVWTGSGSAGWAKLVPVCPKMLLLGKSADAVGIGVTDLCEWLRLTTSEDTDALADELATLPPDIYLDKLLWRAPKKLSDILKETIAQDRSVLRVLDVRKVDTCVFPRIAVLGGFNTDRCIPTHVLNFDVAKQIGAALLDPRNRCVCVYGVSGGGKRRRCCSPP
jgi:hypothetical protein